MELNLGLHSFRPVLIEPLLCASRISEECAVGEIKQWFSCARFYVT